MKPIYKAPLVEQLRDLKRCVEIALDLIDTVPLRYVGPEDIKRDNIGQGEIALCDWVIRPRFTEAQKPKTFAQWWDSLPRNINSVVDSRMVGDGYEIGASLAILIWKSIHGGRCSP